MVAHLHDVFAAETTDNQLVIVVIARSLSILDITVTRVAAISRSSRDVNAGNVRHIANEKHIG